MKNIIQAEHKKIFFLRFSRVYLLFTIGISLVAGFIFSVTTHVTQGRSITDLSVLEVVSANMLGMDLASILLIIFTGLSVSREFTAETIYSSLAVVPDRKKFFMGKYITFFLLSIVLSVLLITLIYLSSQIILMMNNMDAANLTNTDIRQFVLGMMVMPMFYCLLTVAATIFFKSSGGGMAFSIIVMAVPALINMFPDTVQKILLPFMPQSAIHSLSGTAAEGSFEALGTGTSIGLLLLWLVITALIAIISFQKRDF
ncbi:ABC transporter permease [Oceanobacillus sojae]|uniref:ABC transporter permease n=1 Tax=Oceanobacillus sojae TaxID=582851 RepID=UPI0021A6B74F|nr:ABC transporter permease [Oceanobacillus sojae]MCT1902792.1 ABC transporter permease subunit [Oceanobacillus sojae]